LDESTLNQEDKIGGAIREGLVDNIPPLHRGRAGGKWRMRAAPRKRADLRTPDTFINLHFTSAAPYEHPAKTASALTPMPPDG
jgi:hypothetical protein